MNGLLSFALRARFTMLLYNNRGDLALNNGDLLHSKFISRDADFAELRLAFGSLLILVELASLLHWCILAVAGLVIFLE